MTQTATDPSMPQTGGPITATPFTPSFDSSQLPSLSTGLDTSGYTPFDTDFAGAANDASDQAYAGLTQYMDEDFGRANNALESKLINQGLTPGTEAFNNEMSLQQRGQNDARMQAAVQAGNIGRSYSGDLLTRALQTRQLQGAEGTQDAAIRLASRGALSGEQFGTMDRGLSGRGQDLSYLLGLRGQDVGRDTALAGVAAGAAANANAANTSRYGIDTSRDLTLRGLGLQQDQSDFNQLLALINSSRSGVNVPNFGAPAPLDVGSANAIAANNNNAQQNRDAADRGTYANLGATILNGYFNNNPVAR
jgi:hypothetical protein